VLVSTSEVLQIVRERTSRIRHFPLGLLDPG
jgi:hypothetical protein